MSVNQNVGVCLCFLDLQISDFKFQNFDQFCLEFHVLHMVLCSAPISKEDSPQNESHICIRSAILLSGSLPTMTDIDIASNQHIILVRSGQLITDLLLISGQEKFPCLVID